MLGVRLSPDVERRFERFVREQGRAKSDVARTAIVEYMDRHSLDEEFERQLRVIANMERADPIVQRELDELEAQSWKTIEDL